MKQKLTVIIPCKNERKNIRPCIESAQARGRRGAGRRLGLDRRHAGHRARDRRLPDRRARVHQLGQLQELGHPAGRASLGADRRRRRTRDRPLAAEINALLADAPAPRRLSHLSGQLFSRPSHSSRRLGLGQSAATVPPRPGPLRRAKAIMPRSASRRAGSATCGPGSNTSPIGPTTSTFSKLHRYTVQSAENKHAAGKRASYLRMLLSPPLRFLHCYIFRLGFLDGLAGLQISALTGMSSFVKQIRLWELEHALPQPDPEIRETEPTRTTGRMSPRQSAAGEPLTTLANIEALIGKSRTTTCGESCWCATIASATWC